MNTKRKHPRPNPAAGLSFDVDRTCQVCGCIDTTVHPAVPVCATCGGSSVMDVVKMEPEKRKRAVVALGIIAGISLLTQAHRNLTKSAGNRRQT